MTGDLYLPGIVVNTPSVGGGAVLNGSNGTSLALNQTTGIAGYTQFLFQRGGVTYWRFGQNILGGGIDTLDVYSETLGGVLQFILAGKKTKLFGNLVFPDGTEQSTAGTGSGVLNIKAFGAVGNGFNDDTAAIQAALDIGGDVYIPPPAPNNRVGLVIVSVDVIR